jgi:hypothetical protein
MIGFVFPGETRSPSGREPGRVLGLVRRVSRVRSAWFPGWFGGFSGSFRAIPGLVSPVFGPIWGVFWTKKGRISNPLGVFLGSFGGDLGFVSLGSRVRSARGWTETGFVFPRAIGPPAPVGFPGETGPGPSSNRGRQGEPCPTVLGFVRRGFRRSSGSFGVGVGSVLGFVWRVARLVLGFVPRRAVTSIGFVFPGQTVPLPWSAFPGKRTQGRPVSRGKCRSPSSGDSARRAATVSRGNRGEGTRQ